jgi:aminopeptidase N
MKKLKLLFFIIFTFQLAFANEKTDSIDVLSYKINLDFSNFSSLSIAGNTELQIIPMFNNLKSIDLDLLKLNVDSVKINDSKTTFSYNDTILKINPTSQISTSDTLNITVFYNGKPQKDLEWGGMYMTSTAAFNLGIAFKSNPHNFGKIWFPCIDNFTDRATYDCNIKTSTLNKAICGGNLESTTENGDGTHTFHWKLKEEIPTYLASVAVGNFVAVNDTFLGINGKIPINIYVAKADSLDAIKSFKNLKNILSIYENNFGAYMWNKVGYVSTSMGAMEHATNIAYPTSSIDGTLTDEYLYAHELAHHWFGNLITCDKAEDMWINEGWASFCEYIFKEFLYNKDEAKKYIRNEHAYNLRYLHIEDGGFRALYGIPHDYTYSTTVYEKGATVAHSLRGYLGDSLFFSSVKKLLSEFAYKNISSFEMRDKLSEYSGVNLTDFFDSWVFDTGFSHFSVDSFKVKTNADKFDVTVFMKQKIRGRTKFSKSNKVELTFMDKNWQKTTRIFEFSGERGGETFTLDINPEIVMVDVDEKLCDATIDNYRTFKTTGLFSFDQTNFNALIKQIKDSVFLRVEHNWVAPDAPKKQQKGLILSSNRYWKIDGFLNDSTIIQGKFYYSRLSGTNGFYDNDILSTSNDSLVLLYRKNAADDWKTILLKTSAITSGYLIVDTLKLGEYTLGVFDSDKKNGSINSTPNCNETATLTASVSGLKTPFSYKWSNNSTAETITANFSGKYFVTITDVNKDSIVLEKVVDVPDSINVIHTITGSFDSCTAKIIFKIIGGISPYNTDWVIATKNNFEVENLCNGGYAIFVTDNIGCSTDLSFPFLSVKNEETNDFFKLFPNPNQGSFTISINDKNFKNIKIYDSLGKLVFEKNIQNQNEFKIENLQKGIFFVELSNDNKVFVNKVVVE